VTRRVKAVLKIVIKSGFVASLSVTERGGHLSFALGLSMWNKMGIK